MIAKRKPFRSKRYLAFVRSMPCAMCGTPHGVSAHHLIGMWNLGGMGMKAPDSYTMPLCDGPGGCHAKVHSHQTFRDMQPEWLKWTLRRGISEFNGDVKESLTHALAHALTQEESE